MRDHIKDYLDRGRSANVRGLRVLLEYFYAMEAFTPVKTSRVPVVSVFGSARSQASTPAYKQGMELGKRLYESGFAVVTGASRGVMAAANRGVADAIAAELAKDKKKLSDEDIRHSAEFEKRLRAYSLGLRISLPFEEEENPWVGSAATFDYFMVRKFFFATLSQAFIACEGGWGTRDELFEITTLVQTGKSPVMPIIYLSPDPSHLKQDLEHSRKAGYIDQDDIKLLDVVKRPVDAVKIIQNFYTHIERIKYGWNNVIRIFLKPKSERIIKKRLVSVWKNYGKYFAGYRWKKGRLELIDFQGSSYGVVRQFIDQLNKKSR